MNPAHCPLCGGVLQDRSFAVDLDSNCVNIRGIVFKMSPQETEFLAILDSSRGEYVSHDQIIFRLWGAEFPDHADQQIARYASEIRRFAGPFGVEIESAWGKGYRLVAQ